MNGPVTLQGFQWLSTSSLTLDSAVPRCPKDIVPKILPTRDTKRNAGIANSAPTTDASFLGKPRAMAQTKRPSQARVIKAMATVRNMEMSQSPRTAHDVESNEDVHNSLVRIQVQVRIQMLLAFLSSSSCWYTRVLTSLKTMQPFSRPKK